MGPLRPRGIPRDQGDPGLGQGQHARAVGRDLDAELGFAHEDARDRNKLLSQGYRGSRYSFGFPACPNLADQHALLDLLGAKAIGLEMGEEDQLEPEQSTSAIVLHHPQAKYFTI